MVDARQALAGVGLFVTSDVATLDALAAATTSRTYAAGTTIFHEGDPGDELFVLLAGTARVVAGGRPRRDLGHGEAFGEVSLIDGRPRSASIFAVDDVEVLVLGAQDFREVVQRDPARTWALAMGLAERLRQLDDDQWNEREEGRLRDLQATFLANVSHELRTPLTVAIGSIGMLPKKADDPATVLRIADAAGRGLDRLRSVIDGLVELTLARAAETALTVRPEPLGALLDLAVHEAEVAADRVKILGADGVVLAVDAARIVRALAGLVHNAARFGPDGGPVRVTVGGDEAFVVIDVEDEGPGVPLDRRGHLFDLFVQGDASATRTHGGLGIGLPLARAAAERHGGSLDLLEVTGGTTFRLRLPRQA